MPSDGGGSGERDCTRGTCPGDRSPIIYLQSMSLDGAHAPVAVLRRQYAAPPEGGGRALFNNSAPLEGLIVIGH